MVSTGESMLVSSTGISVALSLCSDGEALGPTSRGRCHGSPGLSSFVSGGLMVVFVRVLIIPVHENGKVLVFHDFR